MTFRSFADPPSLLRFLIDVYTKEMEEIENSVEDDSKLCLRIAANLKTWISEHSYDFDQTMRETVFQFCNVIEKSSLKLHQRFIPFSLSITLYIYLNFRCSSIIRNVGTKAWSDPTLQPEAPFAGVPVTTFPIYDPAIWTEVRFFMSFFHSSIRLILLLGPNFIPC
jgi:hypothetical protein